MISLVEIADRMRRGPKMAIKDWDIALFKRISELTKRYDIKCPTDPENWINTDDSLADSAWEAAVELVIDAGCLCLDTERVIRFTEEEVKEALKAMQSEVIMGEGKDARVWKQHKIEGGEPMNIAPGHHAPFTEDLADIVVQNFASIPRLDFLEGFNLPAIDGYELYGAPLEAYASRRQVAWLREGIRKAGRPGAAIVYYPLSTSASSFLATIDDVAGLRPTDGVLLSVLPDVKVQYDLITAALVLQSHGYFGISGSFGIIGGFAGGPEGAIVESLAKTMIAWLVYRDNLYYNGVEHLNHISGGKRSIFPTNFARSVVYQATIRNSKAIPMHWPIPVSELCTPSHLEELVLRSIEATVNGANLYTPRVSRSRMNGGQTPADAELMIEASDAALRTGIKRGDVYTMFKPIIEKLSTNTTPEKGKLITECYDLQRHKPSPEYRGLINVVRKEFADCGLHWD
ncbi:MAG: monomethylamine:corrinoid methyltransferase [Candidatus Bathyarchaeota archaeon]|jgi:methylamine--corrinoid protein Co-methyltransferase|nr:monomethylamine:corrinoid methyltransferase [Candidatus Bathyarchaeota archaeon]